MSTKQSESADRIPPEILAWAQRELNEEETRAGLREIRETGGLALADFQSELEQKAKPEMSRTWKAWIGGAKRA